MYIGYAVDDARSEGVPVSVDPDRSKAQSQAIVRVLSLGITTGSIDVQERPLSDEDGAKLKKILDDWFADKGITD